MVENISLITIMLCQLKFAGKNKGDSSVISRRNLELKNDGKQQSNAITYGALVATNLSLWIVCIAIKLNDIPHNDIAYSVALFVFIVSIIYAINLAVNKNSPQKDIDYYQDMFEKKEENKQNPIRSTIKETTEGVVINYDEVEKCEFVDRVNLFFRGKGSSQEYVKLRIEELDKQKTIYQNTDKSFVKSFVSKLKSRITPASQNRI